MIAIHHATSLSSVWPKSKYLIQEDESRDDIHKAVVRGRLEEVKQLIASGVDLNAQDRAGETPLSLANKRLNLDTVDLLIQAGAGLNAQDNKSQVPLNFALESIFWDLDSVEWLIDAGAEITDECIHQFFKIMMKDPKFAMKIMQSDESFFVRFVGDIAQKLADAITPCVDRFMITRFLVAFLIKIGRSSLNHQVDVYFEIAKILANERLPSSSLRVLSILRVMIVFIGSSSFHQATKILLAAMPYLILGEAIIAPVL